MLKESGFCLQADFLFLNPLYIGEWKGNTLKTNLELYFVQSPRINLLIIGYSDNNTDYFVTIAPFRDIKSLKLMLWENIQEMDNLYIQLDQSITKNTL